MKAISVPTVSVPSSCRREPSASAATVAITPRNSIAGEEHRVEALGEEVGAPVLAVQLVELLRWNCCSRLYAWTTAMPASDSAMCAVTAEMRLRTSAKARVRADLEPARRGAASGGRITERREREAPVEDGQRRSSPPASVRPLRDERREPLAEHVGERVDVAREARDDPARALLARSSAARAS